MWLLPNQNQSYSLNKLNTRVRGGARKTWGEERERGDGRIGKGKKPTPIFTLY